MAFDPEQWTRLAFDGLPIYVQPDRPDWFVPNDAGDRLLEAIRRGESANGDASVHRFLERLPDVPIPAYAGRFEHLATDHLREIWFHITNRCNLTCTHCLFSSAPQEAEGVPADRILEIAGQADQLGARVFTLTGGEPFVHREFERIVDGLLSFEGSNVVVLTNGTLLRQNAAVLDRWPKDRVHFQISVDGLEANHDRLRGEGASDRLTRQLGYLAEAGIPFTISMSVDHKNVDDMPGLVDFAARVGATNVHFMWYFVRGRAEVDGKPLPDRIFARLTESAARTEKVGISIDNIEALKTQVFAPSSTRHDGSNSAWESVAVGPDERLYPSAATIGIDALATPVNGDLATAWRESPILNQIRAATATEVASPLRFILGGGDFDHSYVHANRFVGHDPYLPLHEQTALWLIASEARHQPADGPPQLRLKMGDILESCGNQGAVALTHNNCLLSVASVDGRTAIKQFYSKAAEASNTDILNPVDYPAEFIDHVPVASRVRSYGCGSPVLDASINEGDRVVDLGCGGGVECFITARLVGPGGHVIGVDMLDPMLELANRGIEGVADGLGYRNLEFRKGYLEELPIDSDSIDVVLSNCVFNLSTHKRRSFAEVFRVLQPGGRLVIADVVCETDPDPEIRNDEILVGECIGGALTQRDLFGLLEETGFVSLRVLKRFPYRVVNGHPFFSMTFEACKPTTADQVNVIYRGPFASVTTHAGTVLPVGQTRCIDRSEARGVDGELFILDDDGQVTNVDIGDACGCGCTNVSQPSSCCTPSFETEACCSPAVVQLSLPQSGSQAEPCSVCGKPTAQQPDCICDDCRLREQRTTTK